MPIYAEAKLGELLAAITRKYPLGSPGQTKTLPTGISKRTSHHAQTIAANPDKVEAANELYVAREKLAKVGRPEIGTNVPVKSWNQYCHDIGIEKRTANRWLAGMIRYSRG